MKAITNGASYTTDEYGNVISIYGERAIKTGRNIKDTTKRNKDPDVNMAPLDPPNPRLQQLLEGTLSISELDEEELSAGITKCKDGKFGKNAAILAATLPFAIKNAISKELFRAADRKLQGSLMGAIDSIVEMALGEGHEDRDRLKASVYLLERVQGKTPEVIVHAQDKPWQTILSGVETTTRASARAARELDNSIDADIIEEE